MRSLIRDRKSHRPSQRLTGRAAAYLLACAVAAACLIGSLPAGAQNNPAQNNPAQNNPAQNSPQKNDAPVVTVAGGKLRGLARPSGGAQFLGIPYAEPPVGELRWRAPVPERPWTGIRNATSFGASCPQPLLSGAWNRYDATHNNESCLFLNVTTPQWPVAASSAKPLPVMVWLHGGANLGGSGSGGLYNSGTLPNHGVVLVTLNYRLGVLGFLADPALAAESPHHAAGDYGLMDQILALQWVHDNIARFGGDPANVTLFGQSAGSMDTTMLMTSPLARGLFQKAIGESGAAFSPPVVPLAKAEQYGEDALAQLHLPAGAAGIQAMRKIPAGELVARLAQTATKWPGGFTPDIDGWVLPRSPARVFATGEAAPIPLLVGTNSREFGSSMPLNELRADIVRNYGNMSPRALALYGLNNGGTGTSDPLYGSAANQWTADILFHCPISTEALWQAEAGNPVYEYEFDRPIPGQEAQGALHSAELPYVFGYFPKTGNIAGRFTQVDFKLSGLIETYWTNFARTGNPNGPGLPKWPLFNSARHYLDFGVDGKAAASDHPLRAAQCDLYRERLAVRMKRAK